MLCKIADLMIEIPATGDMRSRCREYLSNMNVSADITIRADRYQTQQWQGLTPEMAIYLESGFQFYGNLVRFDGMMLHASAVALNGRAYLFSGPSGMGKSTHTRLWQRVFGKEAQIFNDDKPALRRGEDCWYAYGTPWCGKDGINQNKKVPLGGICFLKRGEENRIFRLNAEQALPRVLSQTMYKFQDPRMLDRMLKNVEKLVCEIPIFELENLPVPEAARLSYETMRKAAEERGL